VSFTAHFGTYSQFKQELNRDGGSFKNIVRRNYKTLRHCFPTSLAVLAGASNPGLTLPEQLKVLKPTQLRTQYSEIQHLLDLETFHYVVRYVASHHEGRCVVCCDTCRYFKKHPEKPWRSHSRNGVHTAHGCRECYLRLEEQKYKQSHGSIDGFDPDLFRGGVVRLCTTAGYCEDYPDMSCWDIWHFKHIMPPLCCRKHRLGELSPDPQSQSAGTDDKMDVES